MALRVCTVYYTAINESRKSNKRSIDSCRNKEADEKSMEEQVERMRKDSGESSSTKANMFLEASYQGHIC